MDCQTKFPVQVCLINLLLFQSLQSVPDVSLSFRRVSYAFPQRERVLLMLPGTGFIFCLNVQENAETAQEQRAERGELFE